MNSLDLTFGSPMGEDRAKALVKELADIEPRQILNLGCGWGELLLRCLEAIPGSDSTGIDLEEADIDRAQTQAELRGLQDRVTFTVSDAKTHSSTTYDAVINMGAWHALASTPGEALLALRGLMPRGGRLHFGFDYRSRIPTDEALEHMWEGATVQDSNLLPDVVEAARMAGWRLLDLHEATAC